MPHKNNAYRDHVLQKKLDAGRKLTRSELARLATRIREQRSADRTTDSK